MEDRALDEEKNYAENECTDDEHIIDGVLPDAYSDTKVENNAKMCSDSENLEQITEEHISEDDGIESSNSQEDTELLCSHNDSSHESEVSVKKIDERLQNIEDTERRLFSEIREMHKLYHSEFAGRLKTMQDELEQYRKIDKGRAYDDILAAIARIYGNNETLEEEVADAKVKKSIRYMLLDIEDLLEVYGMTKLRSQQGEKRNPRHCQILNRISTDDPAKHDTVVKSYNSGFYIGNRTVIKEVVDVYIFEGQSVLDEIEEKQITEAEEASNED